MTGPTPIEKEKYLAKIKEWDNLGFDVTGLEDLLGTDFDEFKKRRLEILRGQIKEASTEPSSYKGKKLKEEEELEKQKQKLKEELEAEERAKREAVEPDETGGEAQIMVSKEVEPEGPVKRAKKEDKLMLIGKPLPVEPPPPDEEDTILIDSIPDEDEDIEDIDEDDADIDKERDRDRDKKDKKVEKKKKVPKSEETEEEDADAPMRMLGVEAPPEKKAKVKKDREEEKKRAAGRKESGRPQTGKVSAVIVAGIVIMAILFLMMYNQSSEPPGNGTDGESDLFAKLSVNKTTARAGDSLSFNAQESVGSISDYSWDFDDDFVQTSSSEGGKFVSGYFAPTSPEEKTYTVTLTVHEPNGHVDTDSKDIRIDPLEVAVLEGRLDDSAKYRANGNITVTNSQGDIVSFTQTSGIDQFSQEVTIAIDKIVLNFQTDDTEPMTSTLTASPQMKNGFMNEHEVYKSEIQQDLDISGYMHATISSPSIGETDETMDISGTMNTNEKSFMDYSTDHTVRIETENQLDLISTITFPTEIDIEMKSNDKLTSFPNLRQVPSRLRLTDLSDEPIGLDDEGATVYGSVSYSWHAISTDQVIGTPAVKLEFFLDDATLKNNNIDEFYLHMWLGNGYSVPLRSIVHLEFSVDGNDVVSNYETRLIDFTRGTTLISDASCDRGYNADSHFIPGYGHKDATALTEFTDTWTYMPPLKIDYNLSNSFESLSPDFIMNTYVLPSAGVSEFISNNPGSYVTSGFVNRTTGEQLWNITLGTKGSVSGYNLRVNQNGVLYEHERDIEPPDNSSDEFSPALSFAGSEFVFSDIQDPDIDSNIFKGGSIDFDTVTYGITTGLSYPTVDMTSMSNLQTSKLAYFATKERTNGHFSTAIDAETGQLLYKWDHSYEGISIPF